MKFSVNWLREFVDLPKNPEDIAELLTRAGIQTKNMGRRREHRKGNRFANHRVLAPPKC